MTTTIPSNTPGDETNRWALPDLSAALAWAQQRQQTGIAVELDPLGEYAGSVEQAERSAAAYQACLDAIARQTTVLRQARPEKSLAIRAISGTSPSLDDRPDKAGWPHLALALKLSALGLMISPPTTERLLRHLLESARAAGVPMEIDIEGTPSVGLTCALAQTLAREGFSPVLALQAYLDRTPGDLDVSLNAGLKVRLVKGAYLGDTGDFAQIQSRFLALCEQAREAGRPFDVGTHDPVILQHLQQTLTGSAKQQVAFGFLKGLADQTKQQLCAAGWRVAEYVPYGVNRTAYEKRRRNYLKGLDALHKAPAP
jgi:proline dehydrogenase